MAYSLKKMWAAMAVSLIAATSFVGADYFDNQYDASGSCNPCNPCATDCCDPCDGNWFVSADLLYWTACEDGLAFGARTLTFVEETAVVTDTRYRNPRTEWDAGFRIGLGYNLPCDGWDISAYWTHFYNRNQRRHDIVEVVGDVFTPVFGVDVVTDLTRARWRLHLDLFDVELGQEFCVCQTVTLRPFIGVRAAWIHQDYDIDSFLLDTALQAVRLKSHYDGAGLRGGFDTEWKLGCGLSIYGQAAASVLYGEFHTEFDSVILTGGTTPIIGTRQRDNFCACRAITDGALGLRWKEFFSCDTVALTLQLGYEHHLFFNQNRFENSAVVTGSIDQQRVRGDLCTHGVVFSAKLDF